MPTATKTEKPNTSNLPVAPQEWRSLQGRLNRQLTEYVYITGYRNATPDMWYQPRTFNPREVLDREAAYDELAARARDDAAKTAQALADVLRAEA